MNAERSTNPTRTPLIFIVDDEPVVTQSLSALLELETSYEVRAFHNPREALAAAESAIVDLVISDFLMPGMNGLEFLAAFKSHHPEAPRIMLTGYADKENSIRAINEIGLFQYIEKPWDNDQIKLIIDNALTNKSLRERLRERIKELDAALRERNVLADRDQRMREELDVAKRIQLGMLPTALPAIDGVSISTVYIPALEIGGDFYDTIPLAGDRVALLVADLTGHGIQAALSTAVVKFAFSEFRNSDCTGGDILIGMNKVLGRGLPEDTFAAALITIVDTRSKRCRVVNAGLPHPFLLRRGASEVRRIAANGFMLGAIDDSLFAPEPEQEFVLDKGDLLLICSDGLGEAQSASGKQFDEAAMGDAMKAHARADGAEIARRLVAAGREFAHADHPWDDITILGLDAD